MDVDESAEALSFSSWVRLYSIPLLLGVIVLPLSSWALVPLIKRADAETISAWGFVLSAWGVPLAIVGFAVTIWQLARTARSTEAARDAIKQIKRELKSFDIVLEVRTARRSIHEIKLFFPHKDWPVLLHALDSLRQSLAQIDEWESSANPESISILKDSRAFIVDAYNSMQEDRVNDFANIAFEPMLRRLNELDDFLIGFEFKLKEAIGG